MFQINNTYRGTDTDIDNEGYILLTNILKNK